jgi:two-component system sensor histidine kinase SaeS
MSIKQLLLLSYILAGLIISTFTAFMTFYIIDVPIGMQMLSKIIMTITITLPIIALLSYLIGGYFSKKFILIKQRLLLIADEDFTVYDKHDYVKEIQDIHKTLDNVSKRLETSLNELKEKNSELSWMVRSFAHDFRTPLTIIEGNIEAIEDGLISDEKLPSILHKLKSETKYMNELLSDVLSFIQSMKSIVDKEEIELKTFIDNEVFMLVELDSNVKFVNETMQCSKISFTKTDLKKILINLIDNSIKYTKDGTIRIYCKENALIIEDTGIGIDPKECDSIFKAFYTIDESKNRKKSGFGLGLCISKNLAQKNDYTLKCDSNYTKGCRMILTPLKNNK